MKTKTTKKCAKTKVSAPKATKTAKTTKPVAKKLATKAVAFTVHGEAGKSVYLAGDFNDWSTTAQKMTFKNGIYSATVKLAAGTYQYKFVIDGIWCADPENANAIANDKGTFNSVLTVK